MTAKPNSSTRSESSLGLGFFFGILAGVIGTYLFTSPQGKKIRQTLYQEYQRQKQAHTLEEIGITSSPVRQLEAELLVNNIRNIIQRFKEAINKKTSSPALPVKKITTPVTPSISVKKKHRFKVNT